MQRLLDEPAHVLHRRRYSESSLLLELLTPGHGRLGALARVATGGRSAWAALLQPFQPLRVDLSGRGELLRLLRAEALRGPLALQGPAALAGLYLNELLVRLLPRGDACPRLYACYADAVVDLAGTQPLGWTVRRFEASLLAELGYAVDFRVDLDGEPVHPGFRYDWSGEGGFRRVEDAAPGYRGETLAAMTADRAPAPEQMQELRRLFRRLIAERLDGQLPRSWSLLAGLGGKAG